MQQCKHHFKLRFFILVIHWIRWQILRSSTTSDQRLSSRSQAVAFTFRAQRSMERWLISVIFREWLVYAWHMASPWKVAPGWFFLYGRWIHLKVVCFVPQTLLIDVIVSLDIFGSYLLHFAHFLPFTLYSQQFPTRISWSKVYGSHFPPDTGGDCAFFRDGTAGIRYPISIYFHLFPPMVEFVGTALYKVGWTLLKNSRILHITCAARSKRITAFILSQAETEWWLGSWKLIQFLGSASFKGQYQWGETWAQESRWCRKNWGSCNWNAQFLIFPFSRLLRFPLWTSTAAWPFVPYQRLWQVVSISCCLSCSPAVAWTSGHWKSVRSWVQQDNRLPQYNRKKQCLFGWNHVPEADDSLQGGTVMPNDQHMQHRHHLANLCSRNSFPKQDTCDS